MIRRLAVGEEAEAELESVRAALAKRSMARAVAFEEEVAGTFASLEEFPFAKAVYRRVGDLEVRRATMGRGPYALFYIVYPSVDFQTGAGLDIV